MTAVINANAGSDGSPQALLDGFHPAIIVSVVAALVGVVVMASRGRAPEVVPATESALEEAA